MQHPDRTVIVTGGGSGIGRGIALAFAEEGANIVVADVNEAAAQATADLVRAKGRRALAAAVDVSKKPQVQEMARRAREEFGRIDILVNNAGVGAGGPILDLPEETWDHVVGVHLKGTFLCSQAVLPAMIERRYGRIVNIISRAAFKGRAGVGAYSAGKGGVLAFSRVLAQEVAEYGINVNNVAPGTTDTPMVRQGFPTEEDRANEARTTGVITRPIRLARVEEIAGAALYLCSPLADHITGLTIHVNGGSLMP